VSVNNAVLGGIANPVVPGLNALLFLICEVPGHSLWVNIVDCRRPPRWILRLTGGRAPNVAEETPLRDPTFRELSLALHKRRAICAAAVGWVE
jgi:hypothetical protein